MKNFVQPGKTLTVTSPTGGVNSGDPVLVGSIFGIAAFSAIAGADVEVTTEGVFSLPKATGAAWAVGDPLYWDWTAKNLTKTAADNVVAGAATTAAGSADITGNVKIGPLGVSLNGAITPGDAITDAAAAVGNPPTQTEFNNLVTKFNSVLALLRSSNLIAG